MKDLTKKALREAYVELVRKGMKVISVSDVCEVCEASRNTFYYHFSDIADLIESIAVQWIDSPEAAPCFEKSSLAECCAAFIEQCEAHRDFVRAYCFAVNQKMFIRALSRTADYAAARCMEKVSFDGCTKDLCRCAFMGYFMEWLCSDDSNWANRAIRE